MNELLQNKAKKIKLVIFDIDGGTTLFDVCCEYLLGAAFDAIIGAYPVVPR